MTDANKPCQKVEYARMTSWLTRMTKVTERRLWRKLTAWRFIDPGRILPALKCIERRPRTMR